MSQRRRGVTEYLVAFSDWGITAFDIETDLIIGLDKDGYIKRVNPAFEKTLGYREANIINTMLMQYVSLDDLAVFIRVFFDKNRETTFRMLHSWTGIVTVRLVDYKFKKNDKGLVILREARA